jgi:hypothetical protein
MELLDIRKHVLRERKLGGIDVGPELLHSRRECRG